MKDDKIRELVRREYAKIARRKDGAGCCGPSAAGSCCGGKTPSDTSRAVGYSDADLENVPEGADLGLGCGNPVAIASLKKGETVLDLGSGAGIDCFLAARQVGKKGHVIGVDMTPDMLERARANARDGGFSNVEFRLGEIENLPAADGSVDVIISNCVINLSPDKPRVFAEAFRVLRPGGRLMVSDIVLERPLSARLRRSAASYVGCISGAVMKSEYLGAIRGAGFGGVEVVQESAFPVDFLVNDPTAAAIVKREGLTEADVKRAAGSVLSVRVSANKPARGNKR